MPGLLILFAAGLLVLWASIVAYTAWMLTHPPRRTYAAAVARGRSGDPSELVPARGFETWSFRSRDMDLPVWEIPGDDPGGPVVILTHGWADSRIGGLARVNALAPVASRLILWDLPGHGEAPGVCRLGTAEVLDLESLLEHIIGGPRRAARSAGSPPVALYGWSLGAGVSIVAAARRADIAAVIAESPYCVPATPARNVLRARALPHRLTLAPALRLVGLLTGAGMQFRTPPITPPRSASPASTPEFTPLFDRAAHARGVRCPLLLIHGTEDEVCPIEDSRWIARAAPDARLAEIPGARHNDLWTDPAHEERSTAAVRQFLAEVRHGTPARTV